MTIPGTPGGSRPTVSVVMPVYNCAPFLDEAVTSILAQSFPDLELIAVNDGSTDNSGTLLDRFAAHDSRVVPIHQANGGIVSALNRGLAAARGALIARMDGDDVALPQRLAHQVRFLSEHPEVGALGSAAQFIDEAGTRAELFQLPATHPEINAALSQGTYSMLHPTLMIRASALAAIGGGYDPSYRIAEDLDLFLRLGEKSQLANLPEVLLLYRRRANSQTMNYRATCAQWDRRALAAARARGRNVSRTALARVSERASWAAAAAGDYSAALRFAGEALKTAPFSSVGYRSLLRLPVRRLQQRRK